MAVGGSSSGAQRPVAFIDSAGSTVSGAVGWKVVQVAGPATYTTGGIPVDVSATFSRVLTVMAARMFTTATPGTFPTGAPLFATAVENGTDVFTSAKFRLLLGRVQSYTPAGTVAAPTFTGSALGGSHSCGSVGCDGSHPNSTTVPAGTNSAPAFTGTATSLAGNEIGASSAIAATTTYEILVLGVLR